MINEYDSLKVVGSGDDPIYVNDFGLDAKINTENDSTTGIPIGNIDLVHKQKKEDYSGFYGGDGFVAHKGRKKIKVENPEKISEIVSRKVATLYKKIYEKIFG